VTETATPSDWGSLADRLNRALHLAAPPVAIAFEESPPDHLPWFDEPMSKPTGDGRAGRVAAGCVFWIRGAETSFTSAPADHGNCSVGSYTHGLASLDEVAGNGDIATLLNTGWVTPEAVQQIPSVSERPAAISYGPLADGAVDPDVVLVRVNGRQMMVLSDAIPGLRIEGKPQCHIVALAKENHEPAASVGCALSRARTGMRPDEMTCAIPAGKLSEVVEAVERTAGVDSLVAKYAAEDARRFGATS